MSELESVVLLGFHDKNVGSFLSEICEELGYGAVLVSSVKRMLEEIRQREYPIYLMDLNLGRPNSTDASAAVIVYEAVKAQVESNRAKFLGVSGNSEAVEAASKLGIPAAIKDMPHIRKFLNP